MCAHRCAPQTLMHAMLAALCSALSCTNPVPSHLHAHAASAALPAQVLLHVKDEALRAAINALSAIGNGVDELRYAFITSQARTEHRTH